jgi:serine/threonine protein kinase/Tfp pilus assembly protein PilF
MTREPSLSAEDWSRLEVLWERARGLPPDECEAMLASQAVDGALRDELESLLDHASDGEAFFDRLVTVIPGSGRAISSDHAHYDHAAERDAAAGPNSWTRPDADLWLGSTVGHYQIVARLGEGGMGVVYRAIDLRLRRTVALKLLRPHTPQNVRAKERLLVEARAAAALDHANICTIYEVGETADDSTFIAMGFYAGETLEQVMQRGPLRLPVALGYATQIARGLSAAHERGIIHRDVKPANIIITADGVVKLLDFGIARMPDGDLSREGVTPGTLAYMSPEQATSRPIDQRADLWSLGVVLYEMCAGVRPFGGDNAGAILYAILHDSPASVSTLRPELPGRIESTIERLLAKDPARRYHDAEQLLADLVPTSDAPALVTKRRSTRWTRRAAWYGGAAFALGTLIVFWPEASPPAASDRRIAAEDLTTQGKRDVLFRSEAGRRQSLEFFRQAIAVDSTYAPARASLAHMLVMTGEDAGNSRRERLVEAGKAARGAIGLDSSLADAHASLGHVLMADYQLAKAEEQFKRALDLNPNEPYVREFLVWLYIFMNRPHEALEQAKRAAEDNPQSPTAIAEVARALLVNGRCDEALEHLGRLTYLQPPPARAAAIAAQCYARQQRWQKAIDELRPVAERNPLQGDPWLGFMLARAGRTQQAREVRDRLLERWRRGDGGAYGLAVVDAGLRDFDDAFEWLGKSVDDRSLRYNIMEPAFEELRRDPRFDRLRNRLGI